MKYVYLTVILFYSLMNQVQAQKLQEIHIWPGHVPNENKLKAVSKKVSEGTIIKVTEVTDPILQVFPAPVAAVRPGPAVIICPGGGYSVLALDLEGTEIAAWLNSQGISAFVLQYRVPQKRDGALQDAQRAIRIVRSRAAEFNLNPDEIGIMGFSAGASLSARLNSRYNDALYTPLDHADAVSAKPDFCVLIYPAYLDSGSNNTLAPELKLQPDNSPVFIFQTSDDPYGNSALVMASALRQAKVPVELHLYAEGGHGYGLRSGKAVSQIWPALLADWLKARFTLH